MYWRFIYSHLTSSIMFYYIQNHCQQRWFVACSELTRVININYEVYSDCWAWQCVRQTLFGFSLLESVFYFTNCTSLLKWKGSREKNCDSALLWIDNKNLIVVSVTDLVVHVLWGICWIIFLKWNNWQITLGHQEHHSYSAHFAMMTYF